MKEKAICNLCGRSFGSEDGLIHHTRDKHPSGKKEKDPQKTKKIRNWIIALIIIGIVVYGIFFLVSKSSNSLTLPPTNMQGHIEVSPPSHILKEPMKLSIQKHMLEHVDGKDGVGGGIIINYDCKNYECEEGLVEKLESFANKYNNVYVAPFKNMAVKIAITKLGRIETLDELNERKIEIFITGQIPKDIL